MTTAYVHKKRPELKEKKKITYKKGLKQSEKKKRNKLPLAKGITILNQPNVM
jgi:hypothetical protein